MRIPEPPPVPAERSIDLEPGALERAPYHGGIHPKHLATVAGVQHVWDGKEWRKVLNP